MSEACRKLLVCDKSYRVNLPLDRDLIHNSRRVLPFIWESISPSPGGVLRVIYGYIRVKHKQHRYIIVMQRSLVVYHGISNGSLVFSRYTHEPNLKAENFLNGN